MSKFDFQILNGFDSFLDWIPTECGIQFESHPATQPFTQSTASSTCNPKKKRKFDSNAQSEDPIEQDWFQTCLDRLKLEIGKLDDKEGEKSCPPWWDQRVQRFRFGTSTDESNSKAQQNSSDSKLSSRTSIWASETDAKSREVEEERKIRARFGSNIEPPPPIYLPVKSSENSE